MRTHLNPIRRNPTPPSRHASQHIEGVIPPQNPPVLRESLHRGPRSYIGIGQTRRRLRQHHRPKPGQRLVIPRCITLHNPDRFRIMQYPGPNPGIGLVPIPHRIRRTHRDMRPVRPLSLWQYPGFPIGQKPLKCLRRRQKWMLMLAHPFSLAGFYEI